MSEDKPLEDFVANTLAQIIEGIKKAQKTTQDDHISPTGIRLNADHAPKKYLSTTTNHMVTMIEFDVAVTASDSTSVEGKGGISVMSLKIGAEANAGSVNSSVSRIKFTVPIALPEAKFDIGFRPSEQDDEK